MNKYAISPVPTSDDKGSEDDNDSEEDKDSEDDKDDSVDDAYLDEIKWRTKEGDNHPKLVA